MGAASFVEEMCSEHTVRAKRIVLMLPQRQFVAWHMHNEAMSKKRAELKWKAAHPRLTLSFIIAIVIVVGDGVRGRRWLLTTTISFHD